MDVVDDTRRFHSPKIASETIVDADQTFSTYTARYTVCLIFHLGNTHGGDQDGD